MFYMRKLSGIYSRSTVAFKVLSKLKRVSYINRAQHAVVYNVQCGLTNRG